LLLASQDGVMMDVQELWFQGLLAQSLPQVDTSVQAQGFVEQMVDLKRLVSALP